MSSRFTSLWNFLSWIAGPCPCTIVCVSLCQHHIVSKFIARTLTLNASVSRTPDRRAIQNNYDQSAVQYNTTTRGWLAVRAEENAALCKDLIALAQGILLRAHRRFCMRVIVPFRPFHLHRRRALFHQRQVTCKSSKDRRGSRQTLAQLLI